MIDLAVFRRRIASDNFLLQLGQTETRDMFRTRRISAAGCSLLFQFIPAAILAAWSVDGLAAPSVSGLSGSITDGSQITISGSGFGAGGDSPLLWDNFENGTAGATLNANPQVGTWVHGSNGPGEYSTARSYSGAKSLHSSRWAGTSWKNFEVTNVGRSNPTKLFQSFRFMFVDNGLGNTSGGNYKVALWHGNAGYGDWAPSYHLATSDGWWTQYIADGTNNHHDALDLRQPYPSHGVWHRIEIQGKQSSGYVPDGSVEMWMDGVKNYNAINIITRDNAAYSWDVITFWNGVTNSKYPAEIYIDDAYLNDSWARVIVSDSPTIAGVVSSEIQRPISWADGSVVVNLNKGAFADFSTLYLYVVDNNGNANPSGFKLNGAAASVPKAPVITGITIE